MHDLVYELQQLARRNRDGSLKTQYDRRKMLMLMGRQLVEAGYRQLRVTELKGRHITKLVRRWQAEGKSAGTMADRMAALRWWAEKIGRPGVVAKSNAVYGIARRERVSVWSKGKHLDEGMFQQVSDPYIRISVRLILAFGLRRKEALMIKVHEADQGDHLALQASWTKGGLARTIPIVTAEQRVVLDAAKALVPQVSASLIPADVTYIRQRRKFDGWVQTIGLGGTHGLRHTWAQRRYEALAGFPCPQAGGPLWEAMTEAQRLADSEAREILSHEMGHFRRQITEVYIGSNRGASPATSG
jgi:integrase